MTDSVHNELDAAKDALTTRKMLCSDATENNRNTILMAILIILRKFWVHRK